MFGEELFPLAPPQSFTQRGNYGDVPSYDYLIGGFKKWATLRKDGSTKLTDVQDRVAVSYGHKDWQSFTYYIKTLVESLGTVNLTDDEWGFIYDISNGWGVVNRTGQGELLQNVVDGDIYSGCGSKWFNETSKGGEDEDYEPSEPMQAFIDKLKAFTEPQAKAVLLKGQVFWRNLPIPG